MNLNSRVGLLFVSSAETRDIPAMVASYDAATFTLVFTTNIFLAFTLDPANLAIADDEGYVRIRSKVDNKTVILAENGHTFTAGDTVTIYNLRLPFPCYQRIATDGTVYKDFDIAWPGANESLPPQVVVSVKNPVTGNYSEALWIARSTNFDLTAVASRAIAASGDPLTFDWTVDNTGASIGTGDTITATSYPGVGIYYITCTATDQHGTVAKRHIPIFVGMTPFEKLTSCRLTWSVNRGWTLDAEVVMPPTYLQRSPVALVDLDTRDVLFYGFLEPESTDYDFEAQSLSFRALSALAYTERLYSYPFILTSPTSSAANWSEVESLTLPRALHFLMYWHSNLTEIANVVVGDPTSRSIKGQEFTAGTLAQQLRTLAEAAFWELRGYRGGGFAAAESPLYREAASFAGYTGADLSDGDDINGRIQQELARPNVSEARLNGVYRNGSGSDPWTAIIIAAPSHPGDLGNPTDVRSLAPISQAEIERWAARHVGLANTADTYTVDPLIDVDPSVYQVADLPDSIRIEIEDVRMSHDAKTLSWNLELSGRTYGDDPAVVVVPIPPAVVTPEPATPPATYPFYPPLPPFIYEWPTKMYVATETGGVYYASDFSGPDEAAQPTWAAVNGGLPDLRVVAFYCEPSDPGGYQYLHGYDASGDYCMYRREGTGNWASMLTKAQAATLSGLTFTSGYACYLTVNRTIPGQLECIVCHTVFSGSAKLLRSTDYGVNWSLVTGTVSGLPTYGYYYPFIAIGQTLLIRNNWPLYGNYISRSVDGGANWTLSTAGVGAMATRAVSSALPAAVYAKHWLVRDTSTDLDLIGFDSAAHTTLQDALDLFNNFGYLWLSDANPAWQRIIRNGEMLETTDSWSNASVIATLTQTYQQLIMLYPDEDERPADWMVLGADAPSSGAPHSIFVMNLTEDATVTGKSGSAPGVSPYTDSIPYTAGGICHNGIQVAE